MLRTLLESNAPRQRRRGSTVASVAVHTLVIGGAVFATASAKGRAAVPPAGPADTVIYISPREEGGPVERSSPRRSSRRESPSTPTVPRWTFDPTRLPGPRVSIELNVNRMLSGDTIPVGKPVRSGDPFGVDTAGQHGGELATAATVERPAALRVSPRPRYPDQLRAAGVTGRVVVRLVVDTVGRVEPGSVVIRESSHELFSQAVRAVLPSLQFTPAGIGGRKVRMLVELPFEFRLNQ